MSYVADSPAKMSPLPTPQGAKASPANGQDFGRNTLVSLARWDRGSSSWRTRQACLVLGWTVYSETFPSVGMMRNGELFLHVASDDPLSEIGSGLLPSPCARDGKDVSSTSAHLASRQRHQPSAATRLLESGLHWSMISEAYARIMGFPSRWNASAFINSGTPSSPRSRNSSGGRSSKQKGSKPNPLTPLE